MRLCNICALGDLKGRYGGRESEREQESEEREGEEKVKKGRERDKDKKRVSENNRKRPERESESKNTCTPRGKARLQRRTLLLPSCLFIKGGGVELNPDSRGGREGREGAAGPTKH